jgi:GNAT superfamily N-acetyltransferase
MKPEDKKLVAEALLEAAKAVTTSLTDLSEDDWLVVYHGTSLSEVPSLINGFDATRLKYRLYGGPKHRGLFVTPDFKTAERFAPYGEVVLELLVRAKNLHGTDYSGRTGRQQKQEQKTEEWLAGKFPNSFRPYLSLTLTQAVEPQALLIGLVSPKQILRVWHRAKRSDAGRWYTRNEFLALGLEAGPSADEPQGIKKKVEDLGIDLSSPRLSLDEFLDATARLADVFRSRVESALSVRAPKGEDEMVRLIERFGFQPKAAQSFARKFMKSLTNKQVAKVLLAAASKLEASGFDFQPGRVYSFEELPTPVQGDIEQQFDDPDEINEWRFKAELWQPERIPELFDEAGDTAVFHIENWKDNKTGIVDIKELDDPAVREQFIKESPKLSALMKSIKSKGVEYPAVGQEGYHRAIASYLLGKPLPYLALVRPNEGGQLSVKSLTNKQVAKALLDAANALSAASSFHLIFEDGEEESLFEQAHELFNSQGIHLHNGYDRFFVLIDDSNDERVIATAAMCLYDTDEPPSVEFSVAVAPDQQRKGLAKKLVEEVIRYTQQQEAEFDWGDDTEVEAYVVNDKAMVPLLRSFGFEPSASDPKRWRRKTSGSSVQASSQVARKDNGRPKGTFVGQPDGSWEYVEGYPLGLRGGWQASIGLSSRNGWMNLSVEGATEYSEGFKNALREIVTEYPEVEGYVVSFDGPDVPVSELLAMESRDFRDIVFLHGTSSAVVPRIMAEGLRPRGETGVDPAYGRASSAKPGLLDRVYLTTQLGTAKSAARQAANTHGGEPVILEITGLDQSYALPDEDSRAKTAEESLARLGSIAYSRAIPTSKVRAVQGKVKAS